MKLRRFASAAFISVVLLSPFNGVQACGPDFEPDVFVRIDSPDNVGVFALGKLGILQRRFDSNEYAVAWRYLKGGKLSSAERASYMSPTTSKDSKFWQMDTADQVYMAQWERDRMNQQPSGHWLLERAKYAPATPPETQKNSNPADNNGTIVFDENYLNCPDGAFTNAVLTLHKRASAWGDQSPALLDWIHAQDAVFSNCSGKNISIPTPAPADSPAPLKADRAYQIASANFYAGRFDDAASQFSAISTDPGSPWSQWGQYLAARATVRKAFAMGKVTNEWIDAATFDSATMQRAQAMLQALLVQRNPTPSRAIIQNELNFIRIRTEPQQRAAEICAALAGPQPDASFEQDLQDLSWLLEKKIKIEDLPPLLAWIAAWRGSGSAASAYTIWRQGHDLPWLVMALVKADPSDPFAPELIDEAAKFVPGSPAYDTVFYHRVRLLTALKRTEEGRALLDAALPALRQQKPDSKLNALLSERMALARDFNEFLQFAPRTLISSGSEGANDLQSQCNENAHAVNASAKCPELSESLWFDQDAVQVFNQQMPVSLLIQAVNSQKLPQNLRQTLAIVAWTRSVLLQDAPNAAALTPLLPKSIHDTAGSSAGFPAYLAILRSPGIRPYLEQGVARAASSSEFDQYHNNWWCKPWVSSDESQPANPAPLPVPPFIPRDQLVQAATQYQQLQQLPDSATVIGQRVIEYANEHPNDPKVPEALALTVRATRYACQNWRSVTSATHSEYTPVSKGAFELLHKRYPKSPWAIKTRYYY